MDATLQIYLPGFMAIFILVFFLWKRYRYMIRMKEYQEIEKKVNYHRLKRINIVYIIIFFVFIGMTVTYTFLPDYYYVFLPINFFDHPVINSFGLLVLKIALVIMVIAQIHIDKELYKYSREIENLKAMELVYYSEKMLLGALCLMFLGFLITITNFIGVICVVISVLLYFNFLKWPTNKIGPK